MGQDLSSAYVELGTARGTSCGIFSYVSVSWKDRRTSVEGNDLGAEQILARSNAGRDGDCLDPEIVDLW